MLEQLAIEVGRHRTVFGVVLAKVVLIEDLGALLTGFAQEELAILERETFLGHLLQGLMYFHINKAMEVLIFKTGYQGSFEDEVACQVELHSGDDAGDELEENEQREVRPHFLPVLPHGVGHSFQDIGVLAGVDCGHHGVVHEGELLYCECLVQVLLLDVLLDVLIADGLPVEVGGAEEHPGRVVVLVVNDVHGVVPEVFLLGFLLLGLVRV